MTDLLHYKHGSYDFGKIMRRIMLAVAILLIFLLRKPLRLRSFATVGLKNTQGWWGQVQMGFFLSTGMFLFYTAFLYINGVKIFDPDAKSLGVIILQLLKMLLIASLVACIEETFFRGFIFQSLLEDMSAVSAVCISSLFFSVLHFFKVKFLVSPGIQPFVGFLVIYQSFKNIAVNFTDILPSVIGLFLVGVVLSYACLRTKSLYLAMGLHAGWVFLIQMNRFFFDHIKTNLTWFFGDSKVVTGMLGWSLLIVTLFLVRFVTKVPFNGKNAARTF